MKELTTSTENTTVAFRPVGSRILVKRKPLARKSSGGIELPDNRREPKPQEGVVLAVGEGSWQDGRLRPVPYKVGERVLFQKYAGTEVRFDGVECAILGENEVLGVAGDALVIELL